MDMKPRNTNELNQLKRAYNKAKAGVGGQKVIALKNLRQKADKIKRALNKLVNRQISEVISDDRIPNREALERVDSVVIKSKIEMKIKKDADNARRIAQEMSSLVITEKAEQELTQQLSGMMESAKKIGRYGLEMPLELLTAVIDLMESSITDPQVLEQQIEKVYSTAITLIDSNAYGGRPILSAPIFNLVDNLVKMLEMMSADDKAVPGQEPRRPSTASSAAPTIADRPQSAGSTGSDETRVMYDDGSHSGSSRPSTTFTVTLFDSFNEGQDIQDDVETVDLNGEDDPTPPSLAKSLEAALKENEPKQAVRKIFINQRTEHQSELPLSAEEIGVQLSNIDDLGLFKEVFTKITEGVNESYKQRIQKKLGDKQKAVIGQDKSTLSADDNLTTQLKNIKSSALTIEQKSEQICKLFQSNRDQEGANIQIINNIFVGEETELSSKVIEALRNNQGGYTINDFMTDIYDMSIRGHPDHLDQQGIFFNVLKGLNPMEQGALLQKFEGVDMSNIPTLLTDRGISLLKENDGAVFKMLNQKSQEGILKGANDPEFSNRMLLGSKYATEIDKNVFFNEFGFDSVPSENNGFQERFNAIVTSFDNPMDAIQLILEKGNLTIEQLKTLSNNLELKSDISATLDSRRHSNLVNIDEFTSMIDGIQDSEFYVLQGIVRENKEVPTYLSEKSKGMISKIMSKDEAEPEPTPVIDQGLINNIKEIGKEYFNIKLDVFKFSMELNEKFDGNIVEIENFLNEKGFKEYQVDGILNKIDG